MKNKIAILMATYNGEKFLREQFDSLLNQSNQDWVCYIHDDGSKDHTMDIIRHYCDEYNGKFYMADYPKQGGAKNNFLSLLKFHHENGTEPYIMFSDQDDIWLPYKIENTYQEMLKQEGKYKGMPCLVFTDLKVVDSSLNVISESFMRYSKHDPTKLSAKDLFVGNPAPGCTMMINRKLESMAVCYKDAARIEMHDWWCMAIAATFGRIKFNNQATILYRQHGDNTLGAVERTSMVYYFGVLKEAIGGQRYKKTKERINAKRLLATEMAECFSEGYNNENFMFIKELSQISNEGKTRRIQFYIRNHLYASKQHGIWIVLCC